MSSVEIRSLGSRLTSLTLKSAAEIRFPERQFTRDEVVEVEASFNGDVEMIADAENSGWSSVDSFCSFSLEHSFGRL